LLRGGLACGGNRARGWSRGDQPRDRGPGGGRRRPRLFTAVTPSVAVGRAIH